MADAAGKQDEALPVRKTEEECRADWEAQGKPLFGKIWTWEELQTVERPKWRGVKAKRHLETPDEWPKDTVIDNVGGWVFWLPEGWKQGIRTSAAGKLLKCYFNPAHKRFWHKKDIEKFLGVTLESKEPVVKEVDADGESKTRTKYVTDEGSIPPWPEDEEDWLPKDWRICYRQLPSGLHKIYIPPGQDKGFCFHRSTVMEYFASGGNITLTPLEGSRQMTQIIQAATEKGSSRVGPDGQPKKKQKKIRHVEGVRCAAPADFSPCTGLALAALPPDDADRHQGAAAADPPTELKERAVEARSRLVARGFSSSTRLLGVFRRPGDDAAHKLLDSVQGVYFQIPRAFGDRPCYQQVLLAPSGDGVHCSGRYIFWNTSRTCWQMGHLNEAKAGFACCDDDCPDPAASSKPWVLLKESFLEPAADAKASSAGA